ncbi:2-dehydropantoate 2-reductase [Myriangium duriaei CBS 260.36]|uniref:2-dehydropantoate 2-reductase n=1 Tax=Myriangium duriaei CBS 260.36 TaxID=1168546 RepID=A0A9P4JCI5_9PEZI|nr:2-dehydropantoate 2-reductase [Myriangium duriaei CBS 260.36]
MDRSRPRVLLFGAGSIGTPYIHVLQQAGCDVTAVCRSNYDAAKANGFTLNSAIFGNSIHLTPTIVRSVAEAAASGHKYDYVVITTKAFPSPVPVSAPSPSAAAIGPAITKDHTTIVLIQNGLLIEREYKDAYPDNHVLSCVVYMPATQVRPGVVEMGNVELLQIGAYPAEVPDGRQCAEALQALIKSGGGHADVYDDIQERRWRKLMLNCGWNPVCALGRSRDVAILKACDEAEEFVRQVMLEVAAVAQQMGYPSVNEKAVEIQLQRAKDRLGSEGIEPSMMADAIGGRRMEVEAIVGAPMRLGKEKGVSVARLEALYVLTKALDDRLAEARPSL